jgi:hypothetical protein
MEDENHENPFKGFRHEENVWYEVAACRMSGLYDNTGETAIGIGDRLRSRLQPYARVKVCCISAINKYLEKAHRLCFYHLSGLAEIIGDISQIRFEMPWKTDCEES